MKVLLNFLIFYQENLSTSMKDLESFWCSCKNLKYQCLSEGFKGASDHDVVRTSLSKMETR